MRHQRGGTNSSIFTLDHMRINDLRAREELHVGDMVRVIDQRLDGKILKFDCDGRLAQLETGAGYRGWWYVKDLRVIGSGQVTHLPLQNIAEVIDGLR
ncbi:hypothetical protein CCP3SC15_2210005 [Gammaproteobacteria bacterium]